MNTQNNWNLMYIVGNPKLRSNVTSDAENPMRRSTALEGAHKIASNNWRVWVEHKDSGKRIFESEIEKKWM